MQANRTRVLSILALLVGVGLYVVGVAGVLWPATPPGDVGLVAASAMFVLFGLFGFLLGRRPAQA